MRLDRTRSDSLIVVHGDRELTEQLRVGRDALLADTTRSGTAYGAALADLVDSVLRELLTQADDDGVAVVALGSYARRELCPGSDIDVLLVLPEPGRLRRGPDRRGLAERLWYPLWDAGFVTGHGARTIKESLALVADDRDALTALLDIRHVAGDARLTRDLATRARAQARRRRAEVLSGLAGDAEVRRHKPGLVAEMLEPNLKDGGGALRDLHALQWAAALVGDTDPEPVTVVGRGGSGSGYGALVECDALSSADVAVLEDANSLLLELRVALHRVGGGRSDLLALQDQDAVAALLGIADADELVRQLASASRTVAWITNEAWSRLVPGPTRPDTDLGDGIGVVAGRVHAAGDASPERVLRAAASAAEQGVPIDRATLAWMGTMTPPDWNRAQLDAFVRLLRLGAAAVPVFETLDHVGALVRLLPEWEHVRSLPQRNAYHRFTVDRHLLETVAQCAALLDEGARRGPDVPLEAVVARAVRRPELLLFAALLHDIGKGLPGDHAALGFEMARTFAHRVHLDSEGIEILGWLVRDHLAMAEVATRRDLSEIVTIERFCAPLAGDGERLRLLYLLTIGDSHATGPAAWSLSKASLLRDLFVKAAAFVENDTTDVVIDRRHGELAARIGAEDAEAFLATMPPGYALAFSAEVMAQHRELVAARELGVGCQVGEHGDVVVTVVAPDRTGLLATVAGALTCAGLGVTAAALFTSGDGMALDVFTTTDTYGRFAEDGETRVRATIGRAIAGTLDVAAGVEERRRHYERRTASPIAAETIVDLDASPSATVVEVHAPDQVGLLYRLARTFAELGIDVTFAKADTLADRVIDVFYVTEGGHKLTDAVRLSELEASLRLAV